MKFGRKILTAAAVCLAAIALFAASASAIGLKDLHNSPLRALLKIQKAVQNHDTVSVEKYVDLDSFIGAVYDDGIAAVDESGNSEVVTFSAKAGIYAFARPYVIPYAKKKLLERIAEDRTNREKPQTGDKAGHGESRKPSERKEASEQREKSGDSLDLLKEAAVKQLKEIAERVNPANVLKETIDLGSCEIRNVTTRKKTRYGALVAAEIYDERVDKSFVLYLELEPLKYEKGWRVIKPMNFKEYALAIDAAKKLRGIK